MLKLKEVNCNVNSLKLKIARELQQKKEANGKRFSFASFFCQFLLMSGIQVEQEDTSVFMKIV